MVFSRGRSASHNGPEPHDCFASQPIVDQSWQPVAVNRRSCCHVVREHGVPQILCLGDTVEVWSVTVDGWTKATIKEIIGDEAIYVTYQFENKTHIKRVGLHSHRLRLQCRSDALIEKPICSDEDSNHDLHDLESNDDLHFGTAVEVFSETAGCWLPGHVGSPVRPGRITTVFGLNGVPAQKHLRPDSKKLRVLSGTPSNGDLSRASSDSDVEYDPQCNFEQGSFFNEAQCFLNQFVTIQFGRNKAQSVKEVLGLQVLPHNSFATVQPLPMDCVIGYHGWPNQDVLLKVYTLDEEYSVEDYSHYTLKGYIHAMQEPRVSVQVRAGCFVGFVLHKDLNKDWLWPMQKEEPEKFKKFIMRSDAGYEARGDPIAKIEAKHADYLISFSTGNKEENDKLLQYLSQTDVVGPHGNKRITFCTDRSLGFGGHFCAPEYLYLAKHGFGQPTEPGAWFDYYCKAAQETKCGILVLNPSQEYFSSHACKKEWRSIPPNLRCVWLLKEGRIARWEDVRKNRPQLANILYAVVAAGGMETMIELNEWRASGRKKIMQLPPEQQMGKRLELAAWKSWKDKVASSQ